MSVKVMTYVWDNSETDSSELLLLLALADHAADDGYCWPTIKALAQRIRLSERSVMRLVQKLENRGEIFVLRTNRNNRYVVRMGRTDEELVAVLEQRKESIGDTALSRDNLSRDTDVTSTGDMGVTSEVTQLCHPNHQEPSVNRQYTDSQPKAKRERKPKPSSDGIGPWFQAIATACSIDLNAATGRIKGMLKNSAVVMRDKVDAQPEQILAFREWWNGTWRGKNGQAPTIAQLRDHWGEYITATGGDDVVRIGR